MAVLLGGDGISSSKVSLALAQLSFVLTCVVFLDLKARPESPDVFPVHRLDKVGLPSLRRALAEVTC